MVSKILFNAAWYFYVIAFIGALLVSYWLYFKSLKSTEISKKTVYALLLLRFLGCYFIILLLCSIVFKRIQTETEPPIILFAIDNSMSLVAGADSTFVKTTLKKNINDMLKTCSTKAQVKTIYFGNKIHSAQTTWDFKDKETNLQAIFNELESSYSNQNVAALVLISDGIYNAGSNPIYSVDHLDYPVYTLALGDTTENLDVAIQKINYNQIVYLGNKFPIIVSVKSKKCKQATVEVSLFEGNALVGKQALKVTEQTTNSSVNFTLNANSTGIVKYTAKVSVLEGEKNVANNSQSVFVEVIDTKEKLLLLAGSPHPDLSAIREAVLNNSNYDFEFQLIEDFKSSFKPYSLVILHGTSLPNTQLLKELKDQSIPVWIINPLETSSLPGLKIQGVEGRYTDCESAFNTNFNLFGISTELKNLISNLPAVESYFGNYLGANSTQVLLHQKIGAITTDKPLFYFSEINNQKSAVFLGDGLWRWRLRDFTEHQSTKLFDELITKTVNYLSVKNDKSFFRVSHQKMVYENESLEFSAELYNKSYELINEPDVSLKLLRFDKKTFNYTFSKQAKHYQLNVGELRPGEYSYEATTNYNGESYAKKGLITVKEVQGELQNTEANHQTLFQISSRTGGKLVYPSNITSIEDNLNANEQLKPVIYTHSVSDSLIDYLPSLIVILLLLILEWFLRKRFFAI